MRKASLPLLVMVLQTLPLFAAGPVKPYIPPAKRQFVGQQPSSLTQKKPMATQPLFNHSSILPSQNSNSGLLPPHVKLEQQAVDQNLIELRGILSELNKFRQSSGLSQSAFQQVLASAPSADASTGPTDYRRWSYKSGSLVVKGKRGNFEYEQTFSLQGVAGAGVVLGSGAALVACALDDERASNCTKDSLNFIHDLALPNESKK